VSATTINIFDVMWVICSYLYWNVVLTACSYIGGKAKPSRTHALGGRGVGDGNECDTQSSDLPVAW